MYNINVMQQSHICEIFPNFKFALCYCMGTVLAPSVLVSVCARRDEVQRSSHVCQHGKYLMRDIQDF